MKKAVGYLVPFMEKEREEAFALSGIAIVEKVINFIRREECHDQ